MPKGPIFEKKNVIVAGGAGFIGSHLCERLLKDSHVICIDNFVGSSERNIDLFLRNPDFEFIRHDLSEPLDLEKFTELERFKIKFQGIQEIYNLACPTSAKKFDKIKIQTLAANSLAIKNIMELALKYGAKVVHASTSVVYGPRTPKKEMFAETDLGTVDHLSPRGCYDEGKRFAETVVETYRQVYSLDAKIARVFRTYGPRERLFDGEMVPDFVVDALDGRDLVIYGDETFSTSLTYVSDIVDGLAKLMAAPPDIGPVNLGSDEEVKLVDVARKIVQLTGSSSNVRFEAPLLFITPLGLPDLAKAKDKLGWIPLVRLEDGLARAIEYTRANKALIDTMRNDET
jgi:UDP-glucuronate decarboxylase